MSNIQELKELFNKFNIKTLESLDLLLSQIKGMNTDEINIAFDIAYNKKFNEVRDEYEGMNEYDNITKSMNFDISEITKKLTKLNKDELNCLKEIINNAYNNTNYENVKNKIDKDGLLNYMDLCILYNKFNPSELECLDIILDYNGEKDDEKAIVKEIYDVKVAELAKEYKFISPNTIFHTSDLKDKKKQLTDNELNHLYDITSGSYKYLAEAYEFSDYFKNDFDEVNTLLFELDEERKSRLKTKKFAL